jgi:hypothetical protein
MNNLKHLAGILIILSLLGLFCTQPAYAYLDPGSGSYFLQMIIAFLLTSLYVIKIYWHKIKNFLAKLFKRNENE